MRLRKQVLVLAGLAIATLGTMATPAVAATAPVVLDSTSPTLEREGDGYTVSLGITNLTMEQIEGSASPVDADPGCALDLENSSWEPATHKQSR